MATNEASHDSETVREQFIGEFDAKNDDGRGYLGNANVVALVGKNIKEYHDVEFDNLAEPIDGFELSVHGSVECVDALRDGDIVGVYNREYLCDIADILDISLEELTTHQVVKVVDDEPETPLIIEADEWRVLLAGRIADDV